MGGGVGGRVCVCVCVGGGEFEEALIQGRAYPI